MTVNWYRENGHWYRENDGKPMDLGVFSDKPKSCFLRYDFGISSMIEMNGMYLDVCAHDY
jgi:hypothetical protein